MPRTTILVLAGLLAGLAPALARAELDAAAIDADVAAALAAFELPGAAVAVVRDGRVVHLRGYGVRRLGDPTPVDEHTVFAIASCTKAFTAAALGILVDEGRLDWDDRVVDHLPAFRVDDPYVTAALTVRDLLSHRSGLPQGGGDLLWLRSTYDRAEILRRVRFLRPSVGLRARYAYQNVAFIVAGELLAAVAGRSWDETIAERLFRPLGMADASTSVAALGPDANAAVPHVRWHGGLEAIGRENVDNLGGAGAINASAADMSRWLSLQLGRGRIGDRRLYTEATAEEMWSPQTIVPVGTPPPPLAAARPTWAAYGLGWRLRDRRGVKIVEHGGGLAGMTSRVALVPDRGVGVVVLTNGETAAPTALAERIVDMALDAPPTDWIRAHLDAAAIRRRELAERHAARDAARVGGTTPSLPLSAYAGAYRDRMYGEARIESEGDGLVLRFVPSPAFRARLEHWHYDTFVARFDHHSIADAFVVFALDEAGRIDAMRMKPFSPAADFSYDYEDLLFRPVGRENAP